MQQAEIHPLTDGGELIKTPIKSFHGQTHFPCRICCCMMPVAYEVKGKSPATDESQTIYWHYLEDKHGHTLSGDMSR